MEFGLTQTIPGWGRALLVKGVPVLAESRPAQNKRKRIGDKTMGGFLRSSEFAFKSFRSVGGRSSAIIPSKPSQFFGLRNEVEGFLANDLRVGPPVEDWVIDHVWFWA